MSNQNNQKLISKLQSRIAMRKCFLSASWRSHDCMIESISKRAFRRDIVALGEYQKLDKQLLKALCNNMKEHKQAFFAGCDFWEIMSKDEK